MRPSLWARAAFAAGLLAAAAPLARREPPAGGFDVAAFGRLPVLEGGRVKPLDGFARSALLQLRSRQTVRVDGETLGATRWLLDAAFRPEAADTYLVFLVDDPELQGLVGAPRESRFLPYWRLEARRDEIGKLAETARGLDASRRTRFQAAALALDERLTLYERIKNTFMMSGRGDPAVELAALSALMPAALAASASPAPDLAGRRALAEVSRLLERARFLAEAAAFRPLPPLPGAPPGAWSSPGEALGRLATGAAAEPALVSFALMGRAWRSGDAAGFDAALAEHAARLSRERPDDVRAARREAAFHRAAPFVSGLSLYVAALLLVLASWAWERPELPAAADGLAWAAFAAHTAGLAARILRQGRPPVTNLYSSAVFVGWAAALLGLGAERAHRRGFGTATACAAGFATLLVAHHLAAAGDTMEVMRAVLDSNFWLATHVVTITIGYGATYVAGLAGAAWAVRRLLAARPDPEGTKALVGLAYGATCASLFFSFVGTVLGGIWADQSWGRFWGWDPKENGALLLVLWSAVVLHARWGGFARERGLMLMAILGNVVVSLSWFGVNMLGVGLHSYGFMDGAFWWLAAFTASQLALVAVGLLPSRTERCMRRVR